MGFFFLKVAPEPSSAVLMNANWSFAVAPLPLPVQLVSPSLSALVE